jgi:hypothetical protein
MRDWSVPAYLPRHAPIPHSSFSGRPTLLDLHSPPSIATNTPSPGQGALGRNRWINQPIVSPILRSPALVE